MDVSCGRESRVEMVERTKQNKMVAIEYESKVALSVSVMSSSEPMPVVKRKELDLGQSTKKHQLNPSVQ